MSNLHVRDTKNKQSLQNKYQIYLDNANNQTTPLSSTSNITAYYGINLIDTLNKSKFIKAFNEAKTRVGSKDEEGVTLVVKGSESIIRLVRKWEYKAGTNSSSSTIGIFTVDDDTALTGYILEPYGESTTVSGQDKRIPVGEYKMKWHISKKYSKDKYSKNKKGEYLENGFPKIYNDNVSEDRAILIHVGNTGKDSLGCLLPGSNVTVKENDGVKQATGISGSMDKFYELIKYIEDRGIENVKLIIEEDYEEYK